jgi:hypothetical protein
MERFGYHGKVLHVDLGERSFTVEEPEEIFWRVYGRRWAAGSGLSPPAHSGPN